MTNLLARVGMKDVWLTGLNALEGGQPFKQRVAPALAEYSRLRSASAIEAISSVEGWAKNNPDDQRIESAPASFALFCRAAPCWLGAAVLNMVLPSVYRKGR